MSIEIIPSEKSLMGGDYFTLIKDNIYYPGVYEDEKTARKASEIPYEWMEIIAKNKFPIKLVDLPKPGNMTFCGDSKKQFIMTMDGVFTVKDFIIKKLKFTVKHIGYNGLYKRTLNKWIKLLDEKGKEGAKLVDKEMRTTDMSKSNHFVSNIIKEIKQQINMYAMVG